MREHRLKVEEGNRIGRHSVKAIELLKRVVTEPEEILNGCAELFPFEMIDDL